jgi:hypothetical protein
MNNLIKCILRCVVRSTASKHTFCFTFAPVWDTYRLARTSNASLVPPPPPTNRIVLCPLLVVRFPHVTRPSKSQEYFDSLYTLYHSFSHEHRVPNIICLFLLGKSGFSEEKYVICFFIRRHSDLPKTSDRNAIYTCSGCRYQLNKVRRSELLRIS